MAEIKKQDELSVILKKALDSIENSKRISSSQELVPIEQIQKLVRSERKRQKVTRDMLSKLAGVSVGTVNSIETGKLTVSISNTQKVLNALGKKLWIR